MDCATANRGQLMQVSNVINTSGFTTIGTATCTLTAGSRTVQVSNPSLLGSTIQKNYRIYGTGITYSTIVDVLNVTASPIAAAGTFQMNLPATTSTTTTLTFYTAALNHPRDWIWTTLQEPSNYFTNQLLAPDVSNMQFFVAAGLGSVTASPERLGGFSFYSNPNNTWVNGSGQTCCGDGYVYGLYGQYWTRIPYTDLFTANPFGNVEYYLGPNAGTWTGTPANSFVYVNNGSTTKPQTSGWVHQDVVQSGDQQLFTLMYPVGPFGSFYGGGDMYFTQRTQDGTYVAISMLSAGRIVHISTAPSLMGPWTSFSNAKMCAYDYMYPDTTVNYRYGSVFHRELTWPGQGQDDVVIHYTRFCGASGGSTNDPTVYWPVFWIVSGL